LLQDIISSSEKITSRELFAALDKASEKTSFSNDICDCKDDEIFEGSKPTTSNDVACVSYVIERKLVGHLIINSAKRSSSFRYLLLLHLLDLE
jgi:hypothetical protein